MDLACGPGGTGQERAFQVGDRVAEAVDIDHLTFDPAPPHPRLRPIKPHKVPQGRAKLLDWHPAAQMGCDRRKDVAPVEGPADRLQKVCFIFQGVNREHIMNCKREFGRDIGALRKGRMSTTAASGVISRAKAFFERFGIK